MPRDNHSEQTEQLDCLGSEDGSLLGVLFLAEDSEVLSFALGRMPVTLWPIRLFARNGTLFYLLVGGELQDLAAVAERQYVLPARRWNLTL